MFTVQALPDVMPKAIKACEGQTAIFKCHYVDHPPLPEDEVVSWYAHNKVWHGVLAQEGALLEGIDVKKYAVADNGTWFIVIIHDITFNDTGQYACRTVNGNHQISRLLVGNSQTILLTSYLTGYKIIVCAIYFIKILTVYSFSHFALDSITIVILFTNITGETTY